MNLPGVRTALTPQQRARLNRKVVEPTLHERATIYLLLADVLARMSKIPDAPEAKKVGTRAEHVSQLMTWYGLGREHTVGRARAQRRGHSDMVRRMQHVLRYRRPVWT